jgi:hypothetical protein
MDKGYAVFTGYITKYMMAEEIVPTNLFLIIEGIAARTLHK